MTVPQHVADSITRIVRPSGSKLSTRETVEAHADKICREHNTITRAMIHYLETGEVSTPRIRQFAASVSRKDPQEVAMMKGVLEGTILPEPKFQGLSDAQALEAYSRLLLNVYTLEVVGQRAIA